MQKSGSCENEDRILVKFDVSGPSAIAKSY